MSFKIIDINNAQTVPNPTNGPPIGRRILVLYHNPLAAGNSIILIDPVSIQQLFQNYQSQMLGDTLPIEFLNDTKQDLLNTTGPIFANCGVLSYYAGEFANLQHVGSLVELARPDVVIIPKYVLPDLPKSWLTSEAATVPNPFPGIKEIGHTHGCIFVLALTTKYLYKDLPALAHFYDNSQLVVVHGACRNNNLSYSFGLSRPFAATIAMANGPLTNAKINIDKNITEYWDASDGNAFTLIDEYGKKTPEIIISTELSTQQRAYLAYNFINTTYSSVTGDQVISPGFTYTSHQALGHIYIRKQLNTIMKNIEIALDHPETIGMPWRTNTSYYFAYNEIAGSNYYHPYIYTIPAIGSKDITTTMVESAVYKVLNSYNLVEKNVKVIKNPGNIHGMIIKIFVKFNQLLDGVDATIRIGS